MKQYDALAIKTHIKFCRTNGSHVCIFSIFCKAAQSCATHGSRSQTPCIAVGVKTDRPERFQTLAAQNMHGQIHQTHSCLSITSRIALTNRYSEHYHSHTIQMQQTSQFIILILNLLEPHRFTSLSCHHRNK